ncbi:MAG: polysaccharide deacetylase family protein, partial [Bdellovibrionota bacterium]
LLGHSTVEAAAGRRFHSHFFRFPGFSSTPELIEALKPLGLTAFNANIVTEDWATPNPQELLEKSLAMVENEQHGIVLFHDVQPQTAEMLDEFLSEIKKRGFKTVVFRDWH